MCTMKTENHSSFPTFASDIHRPSTNRSIFMRSTIEGVGVAHFNYLSS